MPGLGDWQSKKGLAGTCLLAVLAAFLSACGDEADSDRTSIPAVETPMTPPPEAPVIPADPAVAVVEMRELSEWYRAVLVNEAAIGDPRQLEGIARTLCEGLTVCQAGLWYDVDGIPAAMPVAATQLREQVFSFGRTAAGVEHTLWNCDVFPQFEAQRRCLPRLIQ